jgi:hypothetical protein
LWGFLRNQHDRDMVPVYDQKHEFARTLGRSLEKGTAMKGRISFIPSSQPAWQDRFKVPTIEALREALPPAATRAFDNVLSAMRELDNLTEHLAWHGECWRWTIEFRAAATRRNAANLEPLAVIVPNPADLQLAVPLSREFVRSLPIKRMKRAVRDGLELAQEPFDSHWGVWSITSRSLIDDLQDLVELKLRHLARKAV